MNEFPDTYHVPTDEQILERARYAYEQALYDGRMWQEQARLRNVKIRAMAERGDAK